MMIVLIVVGTMLVLPFKAVFPAMIFLGPLILLLEKATWVGTNDVGVPAGGAFRGLRGEGSRFYIGAVACGSNSGTDV